MAGTPFQDIYDRFLGKITDDMYFDADWTPEDTEADMHNILIDALPGFEFPRFELYKYNETSFDATLTDEEINILAILMYNTWLQRQVASIENIRMKYSGSDFKMTSQANHLAKLIELKKEAERQDRHMQRLYKRRRMNKDGEHIESNWSSIMEESALK